MTTTTTPPAERRAPKCIARATAAIEPSPLAQLRTNSNISRLRRRQTVTAGMPDTISILHSGLIAAEHATLTCERTMVELLYPGDIITAPSAPLTTMITYTTMAPSEVWRINADTLRTEMAHDPALADYVLQRLNLQRARMQLHISTLAALSSEQRVAALLLQAASHLGTAHGATVSFDMPLSRTEVAEYLALNADTLSRIMSRLVREGVLARSSRAQITIRDMAALKAHCPLSDAVLALHSEA